MSPTPADGADVARDILGVLALEDVRRHPGGACRGMLNRIGDLPAHNLEDRALAEPILSRLHERVVEVQPDLARRAGVGERVAAAAALLEELLALRAVAVALGVPDGVAATGEQHRRRRCRRRARTRGPGRVGLEVAGLELTSRRV